MGKSMRTIMRTMMCVAVSLLLLSAMTMSQTAAKNSEKDKSKQQQQSRLSKAAFWRHHPQADKNAKKAQATPASSKQAKPKTAQVKQVAAKQVGGKQAVSKKDQKPEQHASKVTKPNTKKAPAVTKTKQPKEQNSKAGLLKH